MENKVLYSLALAIVIVGGLAVGMSFYHPQTTTTVVEKNSAYNLELVILPGLYYNATQTDQPAYFVLHDGKLQSSAYIKIPAKTLVNVTIINYDGGPADGIAAKYQQVAGTVGNVVYALNSTVINVSATTNLNNISINQNVVSYHSMSVANMSHTFTVLNLFGVGSNLNIPVGAEMVEFAQFYANSTGTYNWQCEVPCGSGSTGWGGAMATAGWMAGTVDVY